MSGYNEQFTKNQLREIFEWIAGQHDFIESFGYGDAWELTEKQNGEFFRKYPLMWVVPTGARISGHEIYHAYNVYVADLVRPAEQNENDVESDTFKVLCDVLAVLKNKLFIQPENKRIFNFDEENVSVFPFTERSQDNLTGHFASINLKTPFNYNACIAAGDFNFPIPPSADCAPSTLNINGVLFKAVASGGTLNLSILNSAAANVGTSDPSNNKVDIADSKLNVNKSDGVLISQRSIAAEVTDNYNVADSAIRLEDSANVLISNTNVKATDPATITAPDGSYENTDASFSDTVKSNQTGKIIPDVDLDFNGVKEGEIVSVKKVEVNLVDSGGSPIVPVAKGLVGNVLTVEPPAGGGDIEITGYFSAGDFVMRLLTIDGLLAANYTSISSDVGSGTIELSINGGAYVAFSAPLQLEDGDTLEVKRSDDTASGYYTITGTVNNRILYFDFELNQDTSDTVVIDANNAATYNALVQDGASGTITFSINGGAYAAFSAPLALVATDTITIKRTVDSAEGYIKLLGIS